MQFNSKMLSAASAWPQSVASVFEANGRDSQVAINFGEDAVLEAEMPETVRPREKRLL